MEMKRIILFAAILLATVAVKAQMPLSFGATNYMHPAFRHFSQAGDSNTTQKKWFFSKYAGLSTGFVAFNGGSGTYLSAPIGVQINRQLNNNLYAFAGVSVTPFYFHYNNAFYQPGINKNNSFMNANNYGAYSAAYMGLMYVNDERTFSISGSLSVGQGGYYNGRPMYYTPINGPAYNKYKQ
jgi:hypothetical protein